MAAGYFCQVRFPAVAPWFWVGIGLIFAALANAMLAILSLRRARTAVDPRHPTTAIVASGPFRYTRNPLYLSLVGLFIGLSACMDSLTMLSFVIPFVLVLTHGVIVREEHYLAIKFGQEYRDYRNKVRRWL